MKALICAVALVALCLPAVHSARSWVCNNNKCEKGATENADQAVSVSECKVTCLQYGGLMPKPTGQSTIGNTLVTINLPTTTFRNTFISASVENLLMRMQQRFIQDVVQLQDKSRGRKLEGDTVYNLNLTTNIKDGSVTEFTEFADESYTLRITPPQQGDTIVQLLLEAGTVLGARHGLATIRQLIAYDDLHDRFRLLQDVNIVDAPVFTHRGISLDTARSYVEVDVLKETISNMGRFKLNTFHWHLTDTHSFPYVSAAYPQLSEEGAYSTRSVYTAEDISDLVNLARENGIRIVPEFDAPAHVGEGWSALGENLVTCFKWEPWTQYCVEPPCGQFDPTQDKVYEVLGAIYKEYKQLFNSDIFHMGGDEVNLNCWRSTSRIVEWMAQNNYPNTDDGFVKLWSMYQNRSLEQVRAANYNGKVQLWSSTLTDETHLHNLDPKEYILQIWTQKTDQTISRLLNNDFSVIFSNYDELYLDCGGAAWIGGPGQNWCSPFVGWQSVYRHNPYKIAQDMGVNLTEEKKKLILGSEGTLWTEQVGTSGVSNRLWPRAAALAERLWSNPAEDWTEAQYRMNYHTQSFQHKEHLQPEWCYQNDGFCGTGA